jgi:hypothetical protein
MFLFSLNFCFSWKSEKKVFITTLRRNCTRGFKSSFTEFFRQGGPKKDAHTTRHLTACHLTASHLTTRHFSTRHPDNSPPYNSPLRQLATLTTRHHYNSSLYAVYAWIILFILIFFTSMFALYCSPDFSFNILQIFSSYQWDLSCRTSRTICL